MRKRPGRPPLTAGETPSPLHVKVPADLHDYVCQVSLRRDVSVSQVVRDALRRLKDSDASFVVTK